jgi:hypothetical protein
MCPIVPIHVTTTRRRRGRGMSRVFVVCPAIPPPAAATTTTIRRWLLRRICWMTAVSVSVCVSISSSSSITTTTSIVPLPRRLLPLVLAFTTHVEGVTVVHMLLTNIAKIKLGLPLHP